MLINSCIIIRVPIIAWIALLFIGVYPVFSQEASGRTGSIEVVVKGKVFSSLKEYRHSRNEKAARVVIKGVPWITKALVGLPADLFFPARKATRREAIIFSKNTNSFRSGIDDKGWKTVWLDGSQPDTLQSQFQVPEKPIPEVVSKPPDLSTNDAQAADEVVVLRVSGVSPSMTALVNDFEQVVTVPYIGSRLVKVRTQDELGEKLRNMAAGMEGPLLILSSHNRIRLMGLKTNQALEQKE